MGEQEVISGSPVVATIWFIFGLLAVIAIFAYALRIVFAAEKSNRRFRYYQAARDWLTRRKSRSPGARPSNTKPSNTRPRNT
jgi:hypothetical protein